MTGRYNVRNYINFGNMDPQAVTFGNLLKQAGYATCIAGKWQLGQDLDLPKKFGFDEYCLWQHTRRPPRYANPGLEINGVEKDYTNGEYGPDLVNDYALDFITRKKDGPFFLYYPMMLTHAPYQPTPDSPDWDPKAQGEQVNTAPKHFGDMVAYMDKLIGKLVARLDALGIRDNTLLDLCRRQRHGPGHALDDGGQAGHRRQGHDHRRRDARAAHRELARQGHARHGLWGSRGQHGLCADSPGCRRCDSTVRPEAGWPHVSPAGPRRGRAAARLGLFVVFAASDRPI